MIIIREIVEEMRILTSFIKNSSKAISIIRKLQINMIDKLLHVKYDVPTSTLLMKNRMIDQHDLLIEFLSFYKSASVWQELKSSKTKLPDLTDKKYGLMKGLTYLLTCFDETTIVQSG